MILQAVITTSLAQRLSPALDPITFITMSQSHQQSSKTGAFEQPLFGRRQIWRSQSPSFVYTISPKRYTEDSSEGARPRLCRTVQGKRVTSLNPHMGGTHPAIPLYRLAFPQETALGRLQFPHATENQEIFSRYVQYQKCFNWGPSTSEGACTQLCFKVFDLSFADPQRLHSLTAYGA